MQSFLYLAILFLILDMQISAQTIGTSNQKARPAPFAPYRFPALCRKTIQTLLYQQKIFIFLVMTTAIL